MPLLMAVRHPGVGWGRVPGDPGGQAWSSAVRPGPEVGDSGTDGDAEAQWETPRGWAGAGTLDLRRGGVPREPQRPGPQSQVQQLPKGGPRCPLRSKGGGKGESRPPRLTLLQRVGLEA